MKQQQCGICSSERVQVRLLLASLKKRIIKQSQEYVPDYKQQEPQRQNNDGFNRLLLLIFGRNATSHASFTTCPHTKFSRYFRRKLKCDNSTFNSLCAQITNKMAYKNYQLQTLTTQIGSSYRTALKEATNPISQHVVAKVINDNEKMVSSNEDVKKGESGSSIGMRTQGEMGIVNGMHGYWMVNPLMSFPWNNLNQQHN